MFRCDEVCVLYRHVRLISIIAPALSLSNQFPVPECGCFHRSLKRNRIFGRAQRRTRSRKPLKSGYNPTIMTRRPLFAFIALLLALFVGSGSALPSAGVWQCRHASRFVVLPAISTPGAMPCHMDGRQGMRDAMVCCRIKSSTEPRGSRPAQAVSAPACRPVFVALAAFSVAALGQPDFPQALAADALPFSANSVLPLLRQSALRQRPPPCDVLIPSKSLHVPGLRAPPMA